MSVLRAIGPALAIAVATTLVAGLTLVPAVVSLLGTRVFWPSKAWRKELEAARFAAAGRSLGRHPGRFAAVSGLVLAGLTSLFEGLQRGLRLGAVRDARRGQVEGRVIATRGDPGSARPWALACWCSRACGQGGLVFLLPVYMYPFVVALGTDYNILMITRLR